MYKIEQNLDSFLSLYNGEATTFIMFVSGVVYLTS